MLDIVLTVAVTTAWTWPHSFGRWLGRVAQGYRRAVNDKGTPDA